MRYDNANIEDIPASIRKILQDNSEEIPALKKDLEDRIIANRVPKRLTKGLVLLGKTGTGKTHTLYAIRDVLKHYGREQDVSEVKSWVEFVFELKDKITDDVVLRYSVQNLVYPKYVFIDDLGVEKITEWTSEMLYLVVNQIYNRNGILFISTNLSLEELNEKYGDRIVDRIGHICEFVSMPDKNYRE